MKLYHGSNQVVKEIDLVDQELTQGKLGVSSQKKDY